MALQCACGAFKGQWCVCLGPSEQVHAEPQVTWLRDAADEHVSGGLLERGVSAPRVCVSAAWPVGAADGPRAARTVIPPISLPASPGGFLLLLSGRGCSCPVQGPCRACWPSEITRPILTASRSAAASPFLKAFSEQRSPLGLLRGSSSAPGPQVPGRERRSASCRTLNVVPYVDTGVLWMEEAGKAESSSPLGSGTLRVCCWDRALVWDGSDRA